MVRPTWFYVLTDIQYNVKTSDWHQEDSFIRNYTMLVMTSGDGRIVINGTGICLKRGSCMIVTPDMTTCMIAGEEGLGFYRLIFEVSLLNTSEFPEDLPLRLTHHIPCSGEVVCQPFSECIDYLEAIYQNRNSQDEMELFRNHVRFQELLRFIFEQNLFIHKEMSIRQAVSNSIEHIKQNYRSTWTVDQMAEVAQVSRWHYTRMFKEITGQIPLEYLNRIRIDRAKHLLKTTDDRLMDIAQHVGFSNEYYFSRRFKQTFGISPGQYRRHLRDGSRVFAPFLEDFLVALGVTPVMQCYHVGWGKQEYLGLQNVPIFDIARNPIDTLLDHKPDHILLDGGMDRWMPFDQITELVPTYNLTHPGEDWRATLRTVADLLGRTSLVQDIIEQYEYKANEARSLLHRSVRKQTVACLRISALGVSLYAGSERGYTGPVLYSDLGLTPHPLVRKLTNYHRRVELTQEWLERLDADHLFIMFDKRHSMLEGEERRLLNTPSWQALPAVRNRCVYEVDFMTWMNYGILSHGLKIDDVLKVLV
ncbi:AraC-type DNA-binding protein [Paenibacillus uliginis N3/975]|uniref:AraC-type DNA-binding protein n=1 Tax=Paenibacillus uliginis N3/975 TaxID=1313296 RepID=A0A1X7HDJ6_9BACL|nr:AraC family transcriptional regulator [Paenibacillus uliginis]SMF84012.1 AraC-type DNA-binding protein [Paenibacillus uliginis N3/975]